MRTTLSRSWKRAALSAAIPALLFMTQVSWGQDSPPAGPPHGAPTEAPPGAPESETGGELDILAEEHVDAGFDAYANVGMLTSAWRQMDSVLVADVALRFAEGERVLMRSHKAITTGQVFDLAIRMATEKRDKETLSRLAKALEKNGDQARLEQVKLSLKFAGTTRAIDPSLQEGTEDELAAIRLYQLQIDAARIDGDRETLKQLEVRIGKAPIKDKQRAALKKLIEDASASLPEKEEGKVVELMSQLGGTSRGAFDGQPDVYGTVRVGRNGQYYRENFWFWKDRIFVVDQWHKGWVGEVAIDKGHMVYRQSSEYVKVLWNPKPGQRQIANGNWVYVNPNDLNTVYVWQKNGSWSTNMSLTQLIENGPVAGNRITVSLPPNIVAAGGGNIVAAGGGNIIAAGVSVPAGIVAAGGGNVVPRPSSPLIYQTNPIGWFTLPKQ